jgi:nicotinic acid mononucleotide adenylyltransferase
MEFIRRAGVIRPRRVGVLAAAFNPPTVAHLHLLEAALGHVDGLLCVVPRVYPHKEFHGATLEERVAMLCAPGIAPEYSVAVSDGGLFVEIAEECRAVYGTEVEPYFICGRDAAERIVRWDYGEPGALDRMFTKFHLLVAPRQGRFSPPPEFQHRIHALTIPAGIESISSTDLRERIAEGKPWEHLTPAPVREFVRRIYGVTSSL